MKNILKNLMVLILLFSCADQADPEEKIIYRDRERPGIGADEPLQTKELLTAIDNCDTLAAEKAIKGGAKINIRNDFGQTPLTAAINFCSNELILKLLELGADTNMASETGLLPLDLLIEKGNYQVAQIMINQYQTKPQNLDVAFKAYLDSYQPSKDPVLETPFTYNFGEWNKSIDYSQLIKQVVERREKCLTIPSERSRKLEFLIENNLAIAPVDNLAMARMHAVSLAMRAKDFCSAVILMENDRFEIDAPTSIPQIAPTLFWEAVYLENIEYTILFEVYGADIQKLDNSEDTPLMVAAQKENRDLVRLLFTIGEYKGSSLSDKKRACKVTEDKCLRKIMKCGLFGIGGWLVSKKRCED